jgi:hypothetical protein
MKFALSKVISFGDNLCRFMAWSSLYVISKTGWLNLLRYIRFETDLEAIKCVLGARNSSGILAKHIVTVYTRQMAQEGQ